MKRAISVLLLILMLSFCGCSNHTSTIDLPSLWNGADRWIMPEEFGGQIDAFHPWMKEKTFSRSIDAVDTITIAGDNLLPTITNQTPLDEIIVSIEGELSPALAGGFSFPSAECISISDLYADGKTYQELPICFLRQNQSGGLYTVLKVETGGYLYVFFDRGLVTKEKDQLQYATQDQTDIYVSGCVYAEEVHSYADYKDIQIGDYMIDLLKIDHSFQFYKDTYEAYENSKVEWLTEDHPELEFYNNTGLYSATVLLEDGLLQVVFRYNDPLYAENYSNTFLDDTGNIQYHYDMNNLKIIGLDYFPNHQTKNYSLESSPLCLMDYEYDRTILPQDYPQR